MARKSSASRRAATKPASGHRTKRKPAAKDKAAKFVYYFGEGKADGNGKMKPLLGGKGANLAEMTRIGLPVPPGFTISTEVCTYFYAHNRSYPRTMQA
jgi:pyruvate,orthophosphate dikinase